MYRKLIYCEIYIDNTLWNVFISKDLLVKYFIYYLKNAQIKIKLAIMNNGNYKSISHFSSLYFKENKRY